MLSDWAILTCHFSPAGSRRGANNFAEFRTRLGPLAARLLSAEVVFGRDEFQTDSPVRIRASDASRVWVKEAVLNRMIRDLPESIRYVAWLDRDAVFPGSSWITSAEERLQEYGVLQLFSRVAMVAADGQYEKSYAGYLHCLTHGRGKPGLPGFAWAARRETLEPGLPSMNLVGGADNIAAAVWAGHDPEAVMREYGYAPALIEFNMAWADRARAALQGRSSSYLPGFVYHLWHGDRNQRQYKNRHAILAEAGFDPAQDVRMSDDGIPELIGPPGLAERVLQFFRDRGDDA